MAENSLEIIIEAKDKASEVLEGLRGNFGKIAVAAAGVGAAITAAMGVTIAKAAEAEQKMSIVNATLATMGKRGQEARDSLLKAADATTKLGFDNETTAESLAKFYQRTGDVNEAIKLNNVAMDLARAKNIELSSAAVLVNQVLAGNGRVLKQYGIDLKESGTPLQALGELQDKVGGQAKAFSQTFAGQSEVLKETVGDLQEKIGEQLLPILTQLLEKIVPIIDKVMAWTNANPKLTEALVVVTAAVGGLLVVLPTLIGFIIAITSPIGLVVVAISVLTAAIIAFSAFVITHWSKIKQTFRDALEEIKVLLTAGATFIKGAWDALWSSVGDVTKTAWEGIKKGVTDGINWIIDKINSFIASANKIIGKAGGVIGLKVPDLGTIPRLAEGGIVNSPTVAMIGEAGPEAVIPLNRANSAGVGGINVTVNVNGDVSGHELVAKVGEELTQMLKLNFAVV